ncbi:hypothetical protein ELP00_20695, partial [Salmonella enterica subsp. enterica serovar Kiambu]|nr:hypothetical protein [Salmonella enterica subsp. enterica serovar Kiambu]
SDFGSGVRTDGDVVISNGASINGHSVQGTDLNISGSLIHDQDSVIHAGSISGQGHIFESPSLSDMQRREALNTFLGRQFVRPAGEPPSVFSGYLMRSQPVIIRVCTDNDCNSVEVNKELTAGVRNSRP